ncbi:hypothetical protein DMB66_59065, partial [Actinoplanes sp. ATCC 53533]|uniref:hypothetical protein n=1 Tax=Actinoplanes sp. ATCC 53533 TaxID=1288362 RepID=UPI0010001ACA
RVSNCVTDWSIDDWYQRWRLRYSAWHCDRYSNSRLLTGLCVDTGSQPMFGAFGTWRNVGISFGADAATLPNTVNNFLEVSSRNGQNGDDAADGVEFGLHASYNADEGVQEYFPYWVEWGQGTEEYHGLSGVGGGDANGRVHSYIVLANDSGEWDILYDFNTVGTTQLQEGAQLSHTYANMSAVYPNTFTLAEPFENRVRVIDGNQQWRRPYLGETSRSEPKSCGALPTDVDPLWDEFNLAPWCMTTSQGTVSVPDLPLQVDYLRIGKPNAGAAKIASRADPRRVDPAAPSVNGVDQKSLQQCLDADPYQCLGSVRGLRECVSKRAICNAGLEPADPAKDITAKQAASAARQLIAPRTKPRAAAAEPAMSVRTSPVARLPQPLRGQIDAPGSAEREVHVVTGDGTVDGLSTDQPDRYAGFTMVYDSQTGVLLYACLGKRCP